MGYDMVNEHGTYHRFSIGDLPRALALAEAGGWEPIGTVLLDDNGDDVDDWNPYDYTSNCGQDVLAEDAANIAAALERIIPTISDIEYHWDHDSLDAYYALTPAQYWSGIEEKQRLREFAAFCREGMFTIG